MIIKKTKIILIFIICLSLLTSCWDNVDVDRRDILVSSGIDFKDGQYEFAGEVELIRGKTESTKEQGRNRGQNVAILTAKGYTFDELRDDMDRKADFPIFFGALETIVFGENYARKGIDPYINRVNGLYDYRKTSNVVITSDPLNKLFQLKPQNNISVGYSIESFLTQLIKKGETIRTDVGEVLGSTAVGKIGYPLNHISIVESSVKFSGIAVMKDSKLVGIVPSSETVWVTNILGRNPANILEIPHPKEKDNLVSLNLKQKKRKINVGYKNGRVEINIDMDFTASLQYQYFSGKISDEDRKELEDELSQINKEKTLKVIRQAQEEFKCDYFNFYLYFRANYPELAKNINWEKEFSRAQVNINVKTNISSLEIFRM